MKLHLNEMVFKQAVQFTSQQMGIPAIYIEKDYWVTYALSFIFKDEVGKVTVFKGGTALSKAFKLIERFSEDIDLVILKDIKDSSNQLTKKIKKIGELVSKDLTEVEEPGLTHKKGMIRKTAHSYPKIFRGDYKQVRDVIVIEASWLGDVQPFCKKLLTSYIAEVMILNGYQKLVKDYDLLPFEVQILNPTRTICEKIMSLVRFSYDDNAPDVLAKKIRHLYDLYKILREDQFKEFFDSKDFNKLLLKVAQDDVKSFKNNNQWLKNHPNQAVIFAEPELIWPKLYRAYKYEFYHLVYGDLPLAEDILSLILQIKERLSEIDWYIELD